jgi:hypothetical protein
MKLYTIFSHKFTKPVIADSSEGLLELAHLQKIWVYRHKDATWWSSEYDIFDKTILALSSKRKVPAEYQSIIQIFN